MKLKLNILVVFIGILFISYSVAAGLSNGSKAENNLSKSHSHLKGKNSCANCHSKPGEADNSKCLTCHKEIKKRITAGTGYHKDKNGECSGCHTEHEGRDSDLTDLDETDFDHSETGFILKGGHKKVSDCRKCHSPSRVFKRKHTSSYLLLDKKCSYCHTPPHPMIKENCNECHTDSTWEIDPWSF